MFSSLNAARVCMKMGMGQYLLIPFLGGWTSIYQLFWCSPGVQGFDTLPNRAPHGTTCWSSFPLSHPERLTWFTSHRKPLQVLVAVFFSLAWRKQAGFADIDWTELGKYWIFIVNKCKYHSDGTDTNDWILALGLKVNPVEVERVSMPETRR